MVVSLLLVNHIYIFDIEQTLECRIGQFDTGLYYGKCVISAILRFQDIFFRKKIPARNIEEREILNTRGHASDDITFERNLLAVGDEGIIPGINGLSGRMPFHRILTSKFVCTLLALALFDFHLG